MRLALLPLVLLPLAMAGCPAMLEGLDFNKTVSACSVKSDNARASMLQIKEYTIEDAADVACGRSNFSTAFWSNLFVQELILQAVVVEMDKNGTMAEFKPLADSVKASYASLEDEKAKKYVDVFFAHQRKNRRRRMTAARIVKEMMTLMSLNFANTLPIESQIALAQATKKAFGVVEAEGMKQARIDTAMTAIERLGVFSQNERMKEFFPKLYELATTNFTMGKSAFEGFANDIENAWVNSTTISHLEVTPAVETLYLQYRSMNDTEAKEFVDFVLASMVVANSDYKPVGEDEIDRSQFTKAQKFIKGPGAGSICHRQHLYTERQKDRKCFKDLPETTRMVIRTTFPEVFAYLDNRFTLRNWLSGRDKESWKKDGKMSAIDYAMNTPKSQQIKDLEEGSGQFA